MSEPRGARIAACARRVSDVCDELMALVPRLQERRTGVESEDSRTTTLSRPTRARIMRASDAPPGAPRWTGQREDFGVEMAVGILLILVSLGLIALIVRTVQANMPRA